MAPRKPKSGTPSVADLCQVETLRQSGTVIPPDSTLAAGVFVGAKTLVGRAVMCPDCSGSDNPQTAAVVDGGWQCAVCGSFGTAMDLLGNPNAVLRAGNRTDRDDAGMPWVIPAGGGTPIRYARASSYAKPLEDAYLLHWRDQRAQALGTLADASIVLETEKVAALGTRIDAVGEDQKDALDVLIKVAMKNGGAWDKADRGTRFHTVREHVETGRTVPETTLLPGEMEAHGGHLASVDATLTDYAATCLAREVFVVNDDLAAAGALDALYLMTLPTDDDRVPERLRGTRMIAVGDNKFGASMDFAGISYTAQQAIYVDGSVYNPGTGARVTLAAYAERLCRERGIEPVPLCTDVAFILHTPLDADPVTHLITVPLAEGRAAALHAQESRRMRAAASGPKGWLRPTSTHRAPGVAAPVAVPESVEPVEVEVAVAAAPRSSPAPAVVPPVDGLERAIDRVLTTSASAEDGYAALKELYHIGIAAGTWTAAHTARAAARRADLELRDAERAVSSVLGGSAA